MINQKGTTLHLINYQDKDKKLITSDQLAGERKRLRSVATIGMLIGGENRRIFYS